MEQEIRKSILIITYYWPPSGGAGVQRWLKFSKYLPEFGWDPIVFIPENPEFDLKDESLIKDVNPDIEVLKFPIWEPYKIFKKLSGQKKLNQGQILETEGNNLLKKIAIWLRGNLFIPDPKIFWVKPSAEYLFSILESNEIKHVVTTGPPHSVHLIGKRLKLRNPALTWVADFRDPWSEWAILKQMKISRPVWKRHLKLEESVIKMADSVLATGPLAAKEFKRLGARRVHYITNGFDRQDVINPEHSESSKFIISHTGMLSWDRNPENLWRVLEDLCENDAFDNALELRLTGILSSEVLSSINALPRLKTKLVSKNSVPHKEVFSQYSLSQVLLLIQTNAQGALSQLPGKLFEYIGAKRPILAIGAEKSDVAKIIASASAGETFDYQNSEGIKAFILKEFEAWQQGGSNWQFDHSDQYERRHLTGSLTTWLNSF